MTSLSVEAAKEELKELMGLEDVSDFQHRQERFKEILQAHPQLAKKKYSYACGYKEDDKYPLHQASACASSKSVVKAVFDAYPGAIAKKSKYGNAPLHYACCCNDSEQVIRFLVEQYPQALEETNKYGETPLYLACGHQSEQVILVLRGEYPHVVMEEDNN